AFDALNTRLATLDILWRTGRPAEVKAGGAIDVADRNRDSRQIGLRYLFPDVGLIRCRKPLLRYRDGAADRDVAEHEQRFGVPLPLRPSELRQRQPRPPVHALARLLAVETPFCLPRIITGLVRGLRVRRKAGEQTPHGHA